MGDILHSLKVKKVREPSAVMPPKKYYPNGPKYWARHAWTDLDRPRTDILIRITLCHSFCCLESIAVW